MRIIKDQGNSLSIVKIGTHDVANWRINVQRDSSVALF
jgi:hypothetical protein